MGCFSKPQSWSSHSHGGLSSMPCLCPPKYGLQSFLRFDHSLTSHHSPFLFLHLSLPYRTHFSSLSRSWVLVLTYQEQCSSQCTKHLQQGPHVSPQLTLPPQPSWRSLPWPLVKSRPSVLIYLLHVLKLSI